MSLLLANETEVPDRLPPRSWSGCFEPRLAAEPAALLLLPAPRAPQPGEQSGPTAGRAPRAIADLLLTLAACLGLLVAGLTVTAAVTGLQPLVVRSGSMEPLVRTGGMVLVRTVPAAELEVGDVVTVDRPDGLRVTHRVVELSRQGAAAELVLQGDANDDPDPLPVVVSEAGRLVWTAPGLGRVAAFFASARGGFVLGCVVTAVALPVLRRREG